MKGSIRAVARAVGLAFAFASANAMADTISVVTSFPKELTEAYKKAYEKKYPADKVEILNKGTPSGMAYVREQPPGSRAEIFWASAPDAFEVLAGEKAKNQLNNWLPDETLAAIDQHLVAIKGPLTTPVGGGFRSLNVALRQKLDLYACVRPVRWFEGLVPTEPAYPLHPNAKGEASMARSATPSSPSSGPTGTRSGTPRPVPSPRSSWPCSSSTFPAPTAASRNCPTRRIRLAMRRSNSSSSRIAPNSRPNSASVCESS